MIVCIGQNIRNVPHTEFKIDVSILLQSTYYVFWMTYHKQKTCFQNIYHEKTF